MMLLATLSLLVLLASPTSSVITNSFQSLPQTQYDFVIVGGGTAGAVIANRLSENRKWNILVIEAGPTHEGVYNSRVPNYLIKLGGSIYYWNYTSVPQPALNNRVLNLPRGHILGGSSQINGQLYTRGAAADYDRWAKVTGDPGWSWKKMLPYILKNEKLSESSDRHDTTGQLDPKFHGKNGLTMVSISGGPLAIDDKVLEASKQLGGEFSYDLDMNDGIPSGLGWAQYTIGNGERSGAGVAYLAPEYANRKNLHILIEHRVTKLSSAEAAIGGRPSLRKVTFYSHLSQGSAVFSVTARKEVVLSAGSYGTPHLLLLSGVGDPSELKAKGVTPLVDLPSVGKNLSDHSVLGFSWAVGIPGTVAPSPELEREWEIEWNKTKTGPNSAIGTNHLAWTRVPKDSPIWKDYPDPASGPDAPHIELGFGGRDIPPPFPPPTISGALLPQQPLSRGSVTLITNNPLDQPAIDSAILSSPLDLAIAVEGFAALQRFYSAPTWADYKLTLASPIPEGEDGVARYIKERAGSAHHPVGTASMSPRGAQWGVVDPDLKLKKAKGLRVVDASVMPYITTGHTQAPVYAIAERAADLIKGDWN